MGCWRKAHSGSYEIERFKMPKGRLCKSRFVHAPTGDIQSSAHGLIDFDLPLFKVRLTFRQKVQTAQP